MSDKLMEYHMKLLLNLTKVYQYLYNYHLNNDGNNNNKKLEAKLINMNFYLLSGEVCLFASAEDADLKKNDAEEQSSGRKIDVV
ncbi:3154_t:CDS:2 [Entrophospora sp. SA101]|nr:3154_t:CDS:2 [Entrophospora sp. SA101]CAJ0827947.1 13717_t:CDS:2 [Entrophospora sp. SA101]CAJ0889994.1 1292_t:CDS:2 [Entrophospora sp. SA101]